MAEFQEVHRQFDRMCWYYRRKRECPMGCPMNGVNISQCRKIAFERPKETEEIVMQWAAEHPEPVYPTWEQAIAEMYLRSGRTKYHNIAEWERNEPIPADIAQKLGIEPKEG